MMEQKEKQEEKREKIQVDWIVVESLQVRFDSINKRLWTALIIAVIAIFVSNALWLYAWMQYDYASTTTTTTYSQDGQGFNSINTDIQGGVTSGAESKDNEKNTNSDTENQ